VCGPACTVVWEGVRREAPSYPDPPALPGESDPPGRGREGGRHNVVFRGSNECALP